MNQTTSKNHLKFEKLDEEVVQRLLGDRYWRELLNLNKHSYVKIRVDGRLLYIHFVKTDIDVLFFISDSPDY